MKAALDSLPSSHSATLYCAVADGNPRQLEEVALSSSLTSANQKTAYQLDPSNVCTIEDGAAQGDNSAKQRPCIEVVLGASSALDLCGTWEVKMGIARWPTRRMLLVGFCTSFWAIAIALLLLFLFLFGHFDPKVDFGCRRYAADMLPTNTGRCAPPSSALVDDAGRRIHRVCFIGDSLINDPNARFDFIHHIVLRLRATYPLLAFDAVEAGSGANTIVDINKRLIKDCLAFSPDTVILYWDSDVSNTLNAELEKVSVQDAYYSSVADALQAMRAAKVTRVAVAGPTLLGEMRDGQNIIPYNKDALLDVFVGLNQKACSAANSAIQPQPAPIMVHLCKHAAGISGPG